MIELVMARVLAQDESMMELSPDGVVLTSGKKELFRYQLRKPADSKLAVDSACYFHPLATPSGAVLTDVAPADHKHHRGIFLAWFDMHGKKDADFWGWGEYAPVKDRVIVNKKARSPAPDSFSVINVWKAEGEDLLFEELAAAFRRQGPAHVLDLVYTLKATDDVKLPQ